MKSHLSNILLIAGAVFVVAGVAAFSRPAGLIALGIALVLGAIATMDEPKVRSMVKKAVNQ